MQSAIEPPEQTAVTVALQSSGAIVGGLWQQAFWAYFDAFLATTRSIPWIIDHCFGIDPARRYNGPKAEGKRRKKFSKLLKQDFINFSKEALTNARNISFHRTGYPSAEVKITSYFGVVYIGSPTEAVPIAVSPTNHPGPPFRPINLPLQPRWSDFTIDGKPLFEECQAYLKSAGDLYAKARDICQQVHGNESLSTPPRYSF